MEKMYNNYFIIPWRLGSAEFQVELQYKVVPMFKLSLPHPHGKKELHIIYHTYKYKLWSIPPNYTPAIISSELHTMYHNSRLHKMFHASQLYTMHITFKLNTMYWASKLHTLYHTSQLHTIYHTSKIHTMYPDIINVQNCTQPYFG